MAITINIKKGNMDILYKMGVAKVLRDELVANGLVLTFGFFDLILTGTDMTEGDFQSSLKLKVSITDIAQGKVPLHHMVAARKIVETWLETSFSNFYMAGNTLPKVEPSNTAAAVMEGHPVTLDSATVMYQPVRGTSAGSKYYVIGLSPHINVAARVIDATVSLRFEGEFSMANELMLLDAGLGVHQLENGKVYWSGHYTLNDNVNCARVVGAVLLGTGIGFTTALPDIGLLVGKGI